MRNKDAHPLCASPLCMKWPSIDRTATQSNRSGRTPRKQTACRPRQRKCNARTRPHPRTVTLLFPVWLCVATSSSVGVPGISLSAHWHASSNSMRTHLGRTVRLTLVGRFEGLEDHEKGQNAPASPFDAFFGGGQQRGANKGPDAKVEMQVTLEDMYNGNDVSMSIKRRVVCRQCKVPLFLSLPPFLPSSLPLLSTPSCPLKTQAQPVFPNFYSSALIRNLMSSSSSSSPLSSL